jgi:hypothetical protein
MLRIVFALLALGVLVSFGQEVRHVPSVYPTIGAALLAANPSDMIKVAPGIYPEAITVPAGVHLLGAGSGLTIIDGGQAVATIDLPAGTTATNVIEGFSITGVGHGLYTQGGGATLVNCVFYGCGATILPWATGSAVFVESGASLRMVRCEVRLCAGPFAVVAADQFSRLDVLSCRIVDNAQGGVRADNGDIVDSVIAGHPGIGVSLGYWTGPRGSIRHSTIFGNGTGVSLGTFPGYVPAVRDTIIWGNGSAGGSVDRPDVAWSNVQGGLFGPGNIDAAPLFVDAPNGNFDLQPGSPCMDAGDPSSEVDPDGTRADMGARSTLPILAGDGAGNVEVNPCFSTAPAPTLFVNGSFGGSDRRVTVPMRSTMTLTVNPYGYPLNFGVLVHLGLPTPGDRRLIPQLGALPFPPCFPGPGSLPQVFHLTNNLFLDPCAVVPSTTAPWTFVLPAAPSVPTSFVVQGIVHMDGTVLGCGTSSYRVTNAVIVQTY